MKNRTLSNRHECWRTSKKPAHRETNFVGGTNVGELLKDISIGRTGLCQAGTNAEKLIKALFTWRGGLCPQENSRSEAGEGMKV